MTTAELSALVWIKNPFTNICEFSITCPISDGEIEQQHTSFPNKTLKTKIKVLRNIVSNHISEKGILYEVTLIYFPLVGVI